MTLVNEVLTDTNREEVLEYIKNKSAICEKCWDWEAGRFVDWYWGSNAMKLDENPDWYAENCRLFRRGSQLAAVAICESGKKDVCILTETRNPEVVVEVLAWLEENWMAKRRGLHFEINDSEIWLADIFKTAGFSVKKQTSHAWEYDLSQVTPESKPAEGFLLETLAEADNQDPVLAGIAGVIRNAFNSRESEQTLVKILKHLCKNPLYLPALSVYARSDTGRIAAYCRGTVNPVTGICGIDPVCCHFDFRRKGLTKAAIQECFRRQAAWGGKLCYIGSAPIPAPGTFLYKSLGPSGYSTSDCWMKE